MKITKDMLIGDIIHQGNSQAIAEVLFGMGMHCLGCAIAHGETIEDAAAVHGVDVDDLVDKLNEAAAK
ncbi:MAG TPA: DUF1858 domain-containing protein [Candidatus Caccalectryoclostridium excrementigallinarum]|uniref:DUF1858 domain-containing protein n=1 Tax=Candidatus Caccalectryoclostridium excrementigallinarum TaxID=2840710 RepID=A0A9D1MM52_9FIRM|nr:DUF1858 domain-containing protein [Candidatus Caccalectryoclostridium excrementigallinarum]